MPVTKDRDWNYLKFQSYVIMQIVMKKLNWRWLLALSSIPSFALLLFYGLAPESPRYLCMKGRTIDALCILEKISLINRAKLPPGMLVSDKKNYQIE